MANLMLQQCRLAGYQETREELRVWISEFALNLQEMIEAKETLLPAREAAKGGIDYLKDIAAQLNLY